VESTCSNGLSLALRLGCTSLSWVVAVVGRRMLALDTVIRMRRERGIGLRLTLDPATARQRSGSASAKRHRGYFAHTRLRRNTASPRFAIANDAQAVAGVTAMRLPRALCLAAHRERWHHPCAPLCRFYVPCESHRSRSHALASSNTGFVDAYGRAAFDAVIFGESRMGVAFATGRSHPGFRTSDRRAMTRSRRRNACASGDQPQSRSSRATSSAKDRHECIHRT